MSSNHSVKQQEGTNQQHISYHLLPAEILHETLKDLDFETSKAPRLTAKYLVDFVEPKLYNCIFLDNNRDLREKASRIVAHPRLRKCVKVFEIRHWVNKEENRHPWPNFLNTSHLYHVLQEDPYTSDEVVKDAAGEPLYRPLKTTWLVPLNECEDFEYLSRFLRYTKPSELSKRDVINFRKSQGRDCSAEFGHLHKMRLAFGYTRKPSPAQADIRFLKTVLKDCTALEKVEFLIKYH